MRRIKQQLAKLVDEQPVVAAEARDHGRQESVAVNLNEPERMAEYEADRHAVREKTARLRALRLARDAANNQTPILPAKKRSALGE